MLFPKKTPFLPFAVFSLVCTAHFLLFQALGAGSKPKPVIATATMELVDLRGLDTAPKAPEVQPAETVPPKKTEHKPKPEPKPKPKPKKVKKITAVQDEKRPDFVQKAEHKPVSEPPPEPRADEVNPLPEPPVSVEPASASSGSVSTEKSSGSPTGGGNPSGGSGTADRTPDHRGGHLYNPKPPYPALSKENGEEGTVRLRVMVEADGRPSSVEIAKSSGYPRLDRSALKTVRERYRFIPGTRGGVAVRSPYTFNIIFKLE